jgi:hypothetical protein
VKWQLTGNQHCHAIFAILGVPPDLSLFEPEPFHILAASGTRSKSITHLGREYVHTILPAVPFAIPPASGSSSTVEIHATRLPREVVWSPSLALAGCNRR